MNDAPAARTRKPHLDTLAVTLLPCAAPLGLPADPHCSVVAEIPPLWQAALRFGRDRAALAVVPGARRAALRPRRHAAAGLLAAALRRRVREHLPGPEAHQRVAPDGFSIPARSSSRCSCRASCRASTCAARAMVRPVDGVPRRRAGVQRGFPSARPVAEGQWRGDAFRLAAGILMGLTTLTIPRPSSPRPAPRRRSSIRSRSPPR